MYRMDLYCILGGDGDCFLVLFYIRGRGLKEAVYKG